MFCLIRNVVSFAKFTIPSQGEVKEGVMTWAFSRKYNGSDSCR